MSATDRPRRMRVRAAILAVTAAVGGLAGVALATNLRAPLDTKVATLLKTRLPKTALSHVDCTKVAGLCEVTAGANLFYVDTGARYLVIGRVYDMQTRQDLTAARLLEINPDLLVGGAARANAAGRTGDEDGGPPVRRVAAAGAAAPAARPAILSLDGLPKEGAIVWGNPGGRTVTVFTDFRCGYCRALSNVLRGMDVRVVERPISVLGSRDLADQVYCARNREEALHAAYAGEPVKRVAACDTGGLDANERFARAHGLGATPVIVRSDGEVLEGYRPKEVLQAWIKGARS
ncbi:DsbC family protein [Sphingomonas sp. MA1305]|jgi:thiol:disulfide interchange protein DsbC|uniref:DsbC family protein n=1 Tax=Sphingomonas sp. MA1305 TaxID=2479204 RepID=UPI0018E0006D|nr:DsbC family protein [Sphingomonas sp. MA1305]MBI0477121.1 DsbC family protein [Sphingomonas sp. MA1305]